jgi:8-oxo-dGTP diphosphatase
VKPVQQIAVVVVEADGQFLVGIRPAGVALAGYHEFPGGKVKSDESLEEAAVREAAEETGLDVEVGGLILQETFDYDHANVHLHFFAAKPADWSKGWPLPDAKPPFQWIAQRELDKCRFPDANARLLNKLRDDP